MYMDLDIYEQIKIFCDREKLSYTDIALKMGISPQAVSQKIKKKNMHTSDLAALADAIGCDIKIELVKRV